ncbi:MAG: DUF190 domain-containing protein [Calditerrivibrio sp.]|nr:DUF190 domain-containing protein [Calditerrivibrio sp.]MCA1933055.1 DUF190 domain-containing protein [Calditerrivibrio sp.]MCA1979977.1 DUF190 domain-containing protein [Calditerrivibrio sp.]
MVRKLEGEQKLVRIFIGESDRCEGDLLYKTLVKKARSLGLSGATVFRGVYGFGASSVIHSASVLTLSEDLPIVVELVDSEENIDKFLKEIDGMMEHGLITVEKAKVIKYF